MYICMHAFSTYIHILCRCMCVFVCVRVCIYTYHAGACVYLCVYVFVHVTDIFTYIHICIIHISLYRLIIYMQVHQCTHTHTHTHNHAHAHTSTHVYYISFFEIRPVSQRCYSESFLRCYFHYRVSAFITVFLP